MGHREYCCDGCQTHNFNGRRFHCLRCVNYDLCRDCYDSHVVTLNHRLDHPMQLLLDHQVPELLGDGQDSFDLIHLPNCYTCPYCAMMGYTAKELIEHVVSGHRHDDNHVVCPMCAGLPGIQLVAIRNLGRHLLLNHIEHANLLDPHTPPLSHALARLARRCRRQRPVQAPSSSSAGNQSGSNRRSSARSQSSRMESEPGSSITYQLSELRRLRPEPNYNPEPDPRLRQPPMLAITGAEVTTSEVATETTPTYLPAEQPDADRFLLHQWMKNQRAESTQAALQNSTQRQQHGLFTEHLLLSMLCEEQLSLPDHEADATTATDPPAAVEPAAAVEDSHENMITRLCCKYIPSQIMMLMSLPWSRPWLAQSKLRYIQLQGVTLDESKVNADNGQQDID